MIIVFIFLAHFVFAVSIYIKKLKNESLPSALLNIALIIVLFAIGWSITTLVTKWIIEPDGFGKFFDRDTISLTILSIVEFFFYKYYYKPDFSKKLNAKENKPKQ